MAAQQRVVCSHRFLRQALFGVTAWLCLGMVACDQAPAKSEQVVTDHRFLAANAPARKIGEDCSQNGASICLSGTCVHYLPIYNSGFVCTRACSRDDDCPTNWRCETVGGPGTDHCLPPQDWKPSIAPTRQGGSPADPKLREHQPQQGSP